MNKVAQKDKSNFLKVPHTLTWVWKEVSWVWVQC